MKCKGTKFQNSLFCIDFVLTRVTRGTCRGKKGRRESFTLVIEESKGSGFEPIIRVR